MRAFRRRAALSQNQLGELMGVSGNYISMIELGKKLPGLSLRKLFETLEQSPAYRVAPSSSGGGVLKESSFEAAETAPPNSLLPLLSTETLYRNLAEVTQQLPRSDPLQQWRALGSVRELLDEIERRLRAAAEGRSEA